MPNRTSPRHADFDYSTPAAYFVTVCAYERRCLFGREERGRMVLNPVGRIVAEEWTRSEALREEVILDAFVIMPKSARDRVSRAPGG